MPSTAPQARPANPLFSSGPCAKRPGWSLAALEGALLGRSHRAPPLKARLAEVIERSRAVLRMPAGWRLGIVPASDTGAVEMALWSLLGPRGVDVLAWESFSGEWATDITTQLKLPDVRLLQAPYGALPDLAQVSWERDVVFVWNGTTSGVRLPDASWIPADRCPAPRGHWPGRPSAWVRASRREARGHAAAPGRRRRRTRSRSRRPAGRAPIPPRSSCGRWAGRSIRAACSPAWSTPP